MMSNIDSYCINKRYLFRSFLTSNLDRVFSRLDLFSILSVSIECFSMNTAIRSIFKLKSERLVRTIVKTVNLVFYNVKTTWLIDSFSCSAEQLTQLIHELNSESQLCVIQVSENFFLANREGLLHLVTTKNVSHILAVNVSPIYDAPKLIIPSDPAYNLISEHISHINGEIRNFLSNPLHLGDVCLLSGGKEFPLELTFVFGWLLCYPFIYFNSDYRDTDMNNLSNIPLKVIQVSSEDLNFVSFSVPLVVLEEAGMRTEELLLEFKKQIIECANKAGYQDELMIKESNTTLSYVAL